VEVILKEQMDDSSDYSGFGFGRAQYLLRPLNQRHQ
jgi:hypothetical protein